MSYNIGMDPSDIAEGVGTYASVVNPITGPSAIAGKALSPLWRKYVTDKLLDSAGGKMSPEGELMLRSAATGALGAGGEQLDKYSTSVKGQMGWDNAEESWGGAAPYAMAGMDVSSQMLAGAMKGKAPKALATAARFYGNTMKPAPMEMNASEAQRNEWVRNLDKWRNANDFANKLDPRPAREVTAISGPRMEPNPSTPRPGGSGMAWGKDLPKNTAEEEARAAAVDAWIAREMGMMAPKTKTQLIPGGYVGKPELTKK